MSYDEGLLHRVREVADTGEVWVEKKMFGRVAIMLNGNMACGIVEDELMVRGGPNAYEDSLGQLHAPEMDFTGRPMKGMVMVSVAGIDADKDLGEWVARGVDFAGSLPWPRAMGWSSSSSNQGRLLGMRSPKCRVGWSCPCQTGLRRGSSGSPASSGADALEGYGGVGAGVALLIGDLGP